jgi:hypothetical protein
MRYSYSWHWSTETANHTTASLKKRIKPKLETAAASHQAELERERERAERLMAELLRAKADALAARATVTRLEGELAALRSRPWWRRLARRKKQPSDSFDVPQTLGVGFPRFG